MYRACLLNKHYNPLDEVSDCVMLCVCVIKCVCVMQCVCHAVCVCVCAAERPQCVSEGPHAIGVEQRVKGRVGVGQQYGCQGEGQGHVTARAHQRNTVQEVERQPAQHEQEQHQE